MIQYWEEPITENAQTDTRFVMTNQKLRDDKPNTSKDNSIMFINYPEVDYQAFSPGSSPGFMDKITLSFTPALNLIYNFTANAMPRPLNIPASDKPYVLHVEDWHKTYIFYTTYKWGYPYYNYSIQMIVSTNNGTTWSNGINVVPEVMAASSSGSYQSLTATEFQDKLYLIYRYNGTLIYCRTSSDQGVTWDTPLLIQNNTIPFSDKNYARMSIAADEKNERIHVVTATDYFNESWSRLYAFNFTPSGEIWSSAFELPLHSDGIYDNPTIAVNSSGTLFLTAINRTEYEDNGFVAVFDGSLWGKRTFYNVTGNFGDVTCVVDKKTDDFILYNCTYNIGQFWKSNNVKKNDFTLISTGWGVSNNHYLINLDAYEGAIFYTCAESFSGYYTINFERITDPLNITHVDGNALFGKTENIIFNGSRGAVLSPYTYFYLWLQCYNETTDWFYYNTLVQRDDLAPYFTNITYNEYISPENIDGILDTLEYNFTCSEDVDYSFQVFQTNPHNITQSVISSTLTGKEKERIIMDASGRIYAFYIIVEGENERLVYHISDNGGLTWSSAKSLTMGGYSNDDYDVYADKAGLYVITKYEPYFDYFDYAILRTVDGGETWRYIAAPENIIIDKMTVSEGGILYAFFGNNPTNLSQSLDGGKTWIQIHSFPDGSSKYHAIEVDETNDRLYLVHQNDTQGVYEMLSIELNTYQIVNNSMFSHTDPNRGALHDFKLDPAFSKNGNTTFNLKIWNIVGGTTFHIETWRGWDNGSNWERLSEIESYYDVGEEKDMFYNSKTNTTLYCEIDIIDYIDTVLLTGESRMVYREAGRFNRNDPSTIDYNGKDFNGEYLAPGTYLSKLTLWDLAKNSNDSFVSFIVDKEKPIISNINWTDTPANPLPLHDTYIYFNVTDPENHLSVVSAYYRHSNGAWTVALIENLGPSGYRLFIVGSTSSQWVQFYITALDLAGNMRIEDNNGTYYGWNEPVIQAVVIELDETTSTYDDTPLSVVFVQGGAFIHHVYINTSFGSIVNFTYFAGSYLGNVPKNYSLNSFSYTVMYQDVWGRYASLFQDTLYRPTLSGIVVRNMTTPNAYDTVRITAEFGNLGIYIVAVRINIIKSDGKTLSYLFNRDSSSTYSFILQPPMNTNGYTYQVYWVDLGDRTGIIATEVLQPPVITIGELKFPFSAEDITTADVLDFDVVFPSSMGTYIHTVVLHYILDNGEWQTLSLELANGTYKGSIGPFPNSTQIQYYITYTDIANNIVKIEGSESTRRIVPAMPDVILTEAQTLMLIMVSAVVGILVGLIYAISLRNQNKDPNLTFLDAFRARETKIAVQTEKIDKNAQGPGDKTEKTPIIDPSPQGLNDPIMKYSHKFYSPLALSILALLILASGFGMWWYQLQSNFNMGVVMAILLFLLTTFFFESVLETTAENSIRVKKKRYQIFIVSILFLLATLLTLTNIFWVGANIPWFNFYIYEDHISFGEWEIPTLWISVATTFFTSMAFVVFSTIVSVSKVDPMIQESARQGTNLMDLFLMREKEIITIKKYIMYKTLAFIVLVVIAMISATNLSKYTGIGLILLIPFILASLIMILILGTPRKKKIKSTVNERVQCAQCKAIVLKGTFCSACGVKIVVDLSEVKNHKVCPICKALNEPNGLFCSICGMKL